MESDANSMVSPSFHSKGGVTADEDAESRMTNLPTKKAPTAWIMVIGRIMEKYWRHTRLGWLLFCSGIDSLLVAADSEDCAFLRETSNCMDWLDAIHDNASALRCVAHPDGARCCCSRWHGLQRVIRDDDVGRWIKPSTTEPCHPETRRNNAMDRLVGFIIWQEMDRLVGFISSILEALLINLERDDCRLHYFVVVLYGINCLRIE
mmetsp:Transcript_19647/g.41419  ORF Transcript_19647/g.41419 Transcript_19647/m.41419 type:complete len:206 (-) Transcript_19647:500-1117(-)